MEEKKINEKESLELISQMIQSTKEYMEIGSGKPFHLLGLLHCGIVYCNIFCVPVLQSGKVVDCFGY